MSTTQLIKYIEPSIHKFWSIKRMASGEVRLVITRDDFVTMLSKLGICKYYNEELMDDYMFVVIKDNIIKNVTIPQIKDEFYKILRKYNHHDIFFKVEGAQTTINFTFKDLQKVLAENVEKLFNKALLEILPPLDTTKLLQINEETNYFFFEDVAIKVTPTSIESISYPKLDGLVWSTHIVPRNIGGYKHLLTDETLSETAKKTNFADFVSKVMNEDPEKIKMLRSSLGYLSHPFMEGAQKAIYLTDLGSTASTPNGRTGKTILARAIAEVTGTRPTGRILDGKNFSEKDQFRWGTLQFGDRLVVLNDMDVSTSAQHFFTAITEGISVRKMQRLPFIVRAKLLFCNNKLLKGDGDSLTDRLVEIELHPYFTPLRRPNQIYKEFFFGLDWDNNPERWIHFYAYMIECSQINLAYRKRGFDLGIKYTETKTLNEKRLLENIPEEFFDFMEEKVDEWKSYKDPDSDSAISPPFIKKDIANDYSEHQNKKYDVLTVKSLTIYLTFYCKYKNYKVVDAKRTDGRRRYQIINLNNELPF
jgi:hypothetical protein